MLLVVGGLCNNQIVDVLAAQFGRKLPSGAGFLDSHTIFVAPVKNYTCLNYKLGISKYSAPGEVSSLEGTAALATLVAPASECDTDRGGGVRL